MKREFRTQFTTRQYMHARDYEIFYYSDHNLKSVENHTHDYYEFYFFLEGDVSINIAGKETALGYGDMIIIPPHVPHYPIIHAGSGPYRRFVFWISQDYCNQLTSLSVSYAYLLQRVQQRKEYIYHYDAFAFNTVQAKLFRLMEEVHFDRFGKDVQITNCVNDLLLHLNRSIYEQDHIIENADDKNLYQRIVQYIESHVDEELTLDALAAEFYVSKYHIAHIFKENIGYSVHQYITKKRLEGCKEAIRQGISFSEASAMYGFLDYSSFYRAFCKEYGIAPKKFREECIQKAETLQKG